MIFAEEATDGRPPRFYYLIHWKIKTHAEDTWERVEGICYLRRLLKKYHAENPDKPAATSPPLDREALPHLQWLPDQVLNLLLLPLSPTFIQYRKISFGAANAIGRFLGRVEIVNVTPQKPALFYPIFPLPGFEVLTRLS